MLSQYNTLPRVTGNLDERKVYKVSIYYLAYSLHNKLSRGEITRISPLLNLYTDLEILISPVKGCSLAE